MSERLITKADGLTPADLDEALLGEFAKSAGKSAIKSAAERDLDVAGLVDGQFASVPAKSLLSSEKSSEGSLVNPTREFRRRPNIRTRSVVKIDDLVFDPGQAPVEIGGVRVPVTLMEYRMLELLARNEEPISRESFLREILGIQSITGVELIDFCIAELRRKLERLGSKVTIRQGKTGDYFLSHEAGGAEHSSVA
jgi:hypothetical protein